MKYIPKLDDFIIILYAELEPDSHNEFRNMIKINEFNNELTIDLSGLLNSKLRG